MVSAVGCESGDPSSNPSVDMYAGIWTADADLRQANKYHSLFARMDLLQPSVN